VTNEAATDLRRYVEATRLDAAEVARRTAAIHADVLGKSKYLDGPNFTVVHPADVKLLFDAYDAAFFDGRIRRSLGESALEFGLSRRMTRAGGQTRRFRDQRTKVLTYEISVATSILFGCFRDDDHRPIVASGIVCRDRLDATQRVMEHEIAHLIEFAAWGESSCNQPRFQTLTLNFFAHTDNRHNLITPRERIAVKYGIKPGTTVRFRFEGIEHTGIVNRINKRATVLVEDPKGQRYSNGKHYIKFYMPAGSLTRVE
jgi:hypothetical protein